MPHRFQVPCKRRRRTRVPLKLRMDLAKWMETIFRDERTKPTTATRKKQLRTVSTIESRITRLRNSLADWLERSRLLDGAK